MNEVVLLRAALTIGSGGPLRTLTGALAPSGVGWGRRGVRDVGAGGGIFRACLNRTHRRLPACLPLRPLVWVGRAKMKKNVQVTHWPSPAGTPRRRERPDRRRDSSEEGLEILLLFLLLILPELKLNLHRHGYFREANNTWVIRFWGLKQRLLWKGNAF